MAVVSSRVISCELARRGVRWCVQDLIRLVAYDQQNVHLPMTTFNLVDNTRDSDTFAIRLEHGKGVLYTRRALVARHTYELRVRAKSYDHRRIGVQYETSFVIFIAVSNFPY